jgi:antitoxin HicB
MKSKTKHSKRWVQRQVLKYLSLPYTTTLRKEEDDQVCYYVVTVDELPGCSTHGTSALEALANLYEVQRAWLSMSLDLGLHIPLPNDPSKLPSGKWIQRVPRSLHLKLTLLAKKENVSLNQLVTSILGEAVGMKNVKGS